MALHDVDRTNPDRSSPVVHAHDSQDVTQRMAHGTTSLNPVTDATPQIGRVVTKNNQILIHDGFNVRIIIGYLPDGTFGFAVSKQGFDVADGF